jgi:GNAT superfamily N-acetyltransferase
MAATEADAGLAPLVALEEADAASALALSEEAGWNQTVEDWSLMIRLGRAFAVLGSDRRPVATALAIPYPPDFGWISMVLVHAPFRKRGLGTRLLERATSELRSGGLVPVLDATPAGRPVYERIGFRPIDALTRWRGEGGGAPPPAALPSVSQGELGALAAFDRAAFGADRSAVLADLLARPGAVSRRDPRSNGFILSRPGRTALQVGPVVARETGTAVTLVEVALAAVSGPVVVDVPDRQAAVAELLARRRFRAERGFTRMALERDTGFGDPALVRAVAGPELG